MILALTSKTLPSGAVFRCGGLRHRPADRPRSGVAEARLAGSEQPAIRIQLDPSRLASMNIGVDQVANAIFRRQYPRRRRGFRRVDRSWSIATNDQLTTPEDFRAIVIASNKGTVIRLGDIARVERGVRKPPRRRLVQRSAGGASSISRGSPTPMSTRWSTG